MLERQGLEDSKKVTPLVASTRRALGRLRERVQFLAGCPYDRESEEGKKKQRGGRICTGRKKTY